MLLFFTTGSQQIFIICIQLLRLQFILTLSNLLFLPSVELAEHSDKTFQVTLVWQNDIWQVILHKGRPQTFLNIFQLCFVISLIALCSSYVQLNGIVLIIYLIFDSIVNMLSRFMNWLIHFRAHYMSNLKIN